MRRKDALQLAVEVLTTEAEKIRMQSWRWPTWLNDERRAKLHRRDKLMDAATLIKKMAAKLQQ